MHDWLAAPPDSYSLQIQECWWFTQPVQVFSRQCGDKEANIDVRSNSMTFLPVALQLLLQQSLQACPEVATTTASHFLQQFQVCPTEVVAIQVAAPFIGLLKKKQLSEIIARASWGPILPGCPPEWFGKIHRQSVDASCLDKKMQVKALAVPSLEAAQPWQKFQSDIVVIRHLAKHVSQWDGELQNEVLKAIQHLEEVDFLVSDKTMCINVENSKSRVQCSAFIASCTRSVFFSSICYLLSAIFSHAATHLTFHAGSNPIFGSIFACSPSSPEKVGRTRPR